MLPMLSVFSDEGHLMDTDGLQDPLVQRADLGRMPARMSQKSSRADDGREGLSSLSSFRDGRGFKRGSFVPRAMTSSVLILL